MRRFEGKVCIITASSSGIGLSTARLMGLEGGKIIVNSRKQSNVTAAIESLRKENIVCEGIACSVSKHRKRIIDFAIEKYGTIDILVHNAASSRHVGFVSETPEEAYDDMLDTNLKAPFFLTKEALPYLKRSQGKIIFITSISSFKPISQIGIYSMTKSALITLSKTLANELAKDKIRVNCVAPGPIDTRFLGPFRGNENSQTPMMRIGSPTEVAEVIAFLCGDDADYINGETVIVSGGKEC